MSNEREKVFKIILINILIMLIFNINAEYAEYATSEADTDNNNDNNSDDRALYGKDSRRDILKTDIFYQKLAKSIAVRIEKNNFDSRKSRFSYNLMPIDSHERFAQWPSAAKCTGFLIATTPQYILATAGHCIPNAMACKSFDWVFDFYYDKSTIIDDRKEGKWIQYKERQRYECKRIITQKNENGRDYALIELSPNKEDYLKRSALPINLKTSDAKKKALNRLARGSAVFTIGSPNGYPLIYASGKVASYIELNESYGVGEYRVLTNLDTFQGNSGSPVFSAEGVIEGILVAGKNDFDEDGHTINYGSDLKKGEEAIFPIGLVPNISTLTYSSANGDISRYQKEIFSALKLRPSEAYYWIQKITEKSGFSLEERSIYGFTPLLLAADMGYYNVVELLKYRGALLEAKSDRGPTALIIAAWNGNLNTVKTLLRLGANINAKTNNGSTALMKASEKGFFEIVKLLVLSGAKIDMKNELDRDALWYASKDRGAHEEIYRYLMGAKK